MNKTELAGKIKALEGLTNEEKTALLGLLREQKKYGIVWEDKPEDVEQQLTKELPVLMPKEGKEWLISDNPVSPNHILIEGDNLHALTALSYTHEGKIDFIYIDPPYNTGNKDFKYNDSFVDVEDGYRHSKWLSFINKRLKAAKKLLNDSGLLFISIGDDEVAQLKLLCDELFDVIALVPRIAKKGSDQGTYFRPTKDYIIVCCNNKSNIGAFGDPTIETASNRQYNLIEEGSNRHFRKAHSFYQASLDPMRGCSNQRYYMQAPDGTLIIPPGNVFPTEAMDGAKITPQSRQDKVWRWSQESYLSKKHLIYFDKSKRSPLVDSNGNHTDWNAYEKKYEDEEMETEDFPLPNDVIDGFINTLGTSLLNSMGIDFSFSKPVELIRYLITITQKPKDITILDFFAGSGTTLHATMLLNESDGGKRKCILVTNNENNICEEITYERNKRVIEGYTSSNHEDIAGLHDNTLRYYKTAFVSAERTSSSKRKLMAAATDMLCIKNNIYQEEPTLGGRKLKASVARHFCEGGKEMLVVYNEDAVPAVVELLRTIEVEGKIIVYVFSNTNYAYNDDFQEVADKIELCALPDAIYRAYKSVISRVKPIDVGENETNSQEDEAETQQELTLNFEEEAQQ